VNPTGTGHSCDPDNSDWERVCLRMWFAEDLRKTLRAAEQHALNHPDGAADLLRELGYHAGLLGWHLDKRRTQLAATPPSKESTP
jgi:hypothetical protein